MIVNTCESFRGGAPLSVTRTVMGLVRGLWQLWRTIADLYRELRVGRHELHRSPWHHDRAHAGVDDAI